MKINNNEFTEIAFIFEKENGRNHSEFEKEIIENSKWKNNSAYELEMVIISGIQSGLYENELDKVSAYWALSKRNNEKLIPNFKKWLKIELESENSIAVFQILVALDLLGEKPFAKERIGRDSNETKLNLRDAKKYLK